MRKLLTNRPIVAWALYDWANSAFATTVMAGFFPLFFQGYWSRDVAPAGTSFRLEVANAIAGLALAILAPILGAIADRSGRRKRFLLLFTLLGCLSTAALYMVAEGNWLFAAALFVFATIGFNGGVVFNDSLLLDVAKPEELDRVSALGYSLGYLGGGLLFLVNVMMYLKPAWFGLTSGAQGVLLSFVTVAVWWLVFTLPLMRYVKSQPGVQLPMGESIRLGMRELRNTLSHLRQYRTMVIFLIAYWFYIDGVNTIIKMAVDYGTTLKDIEGNRLIADDKLIVALLITQFVGFPSALLFGWLGGRIGARTGILIGIAAYIGITTYAYFLSSAAEFLALAVAVGLVQGGVQSLSRSMFGRLVPEGKSAEFFGFFNMLGKFATFFGPMLMAVVTYFTGNTRASILSLLALFIIGGMLLWRVPAQDR
jgi:UMF1 family MFS transporter